MTNTGMIGTKDAMSAYASQVKQTNETKETKKVSEYGATVGEPKLSDKAAKYYEQLKKKFGQYDFILVSKDQKANAQANASKYANNIKTVVLIDEEKIEKMATDEKFRKKYEGILSGATQQLEQLKNSVASSGAEVKGYGMEIKDDGTASYFAVLKKSFAAQKARIEKAAAQKAADKKAAAKKAEKKAKEERLQEGMKKRRADGSKEIEDEETITISAGSIEELMDKIADYKMEERSNQVQTPQEMMLGQSIDFKG